MKKMLLCLLILTASSIEVHCAVVTHQVCPGKCPYESPPILPCEGIYLPQTAMPVATMPETTVYVQQGIVPEIAVPGVTKIETTVPVLPFITELPNCPDICFKDILRAPLGCLDPILNTYSTTEVCPLPDVSISPLLPSSSPISGLASPFSKLLPPLTDCGCYGNFLKKVPIPPPFI